MSENSVFGMLSRTRGRVWFPSLAVCFVVVFLWFRYQYRGVYPTSAFSKQYSQTGTKISTAIGNNSLGFEKVFVINAPWRTDRKDYISIAASYSGIAIQWIDGVDPENIREKAYPAGDHRLVSDGLKGCWRAHLNALREIVYQNLTTALILEDDADWDFRIRSQLSSISPGVQNIQNLVTQSEKHAAKHPPSFEQHSSDAELAERSSLNTTLLASSALSKDEPYGRDWDLLWLGHCGAHLPPASPNSPNRVMISNDETVPEPQYLRPMAHAPLDTMGSLYPPHTRLVHQANVTTCANAYAVTQMGARKLLYELGIRQFNKGLDFALSDYCNGKTDAQIEYGTPTPMCVVVQPPVFGHYFGEKAGSDITGVGSGGRPERGSRYIKWSVRMNLERLVKGEDGVVEQWPNTEPKG